MLTEIYNYINDKELDTSDVAALTSTLQAVTELQHTPKSEVNNFIVSRSLNLKLRAIANEPIPHAQYDAEIPGTGGLTLRLAAQAGLDWLLADSGAMVNPENETLNNLIGLLHGATVFSNDEVAAFWALFAKPRWPDLQGNRKAGEEYSPEDIAKAQAIVRGALNTPAIAATAQIISDGEALDSELTEAEYSRQSARQNELAALRLVKDELESGVVREVPEVPGGEAWND